MSTHTTTWSVTGMTCGHCVASVTEEIGELDGVQDVAVVLDTGTVTVTSTQPPRPRRRPGRRRGGRVRAGLR